MPTFKVYINGYWVTAEAQDSDMVNGIHFRIHEGKLQYSTDELNWYDVT